MFKKKEVVYDARGNRQEWKAAKQKLKDAGIKIAESGSYETEAPICGCGARLDARDFGPGGRIDRLSYFIMVKAEDLQKAKNVLGDLVNSHQSTVGRV